MNIEFGTTKGPCNTKFAPLAALGLYWRQSGTLQPLQNGLYVPERAAFSTADKLIQVLVSMLAGCEYICEVNSFLRTEFDLAQAWGFERYLEQSSLAIALNQLSRTQLEQIEQAVGVIWAANSRALQHDWRGFLRLDLDLSGLPCGKNAEMSEKGFFSGKKTPLAVNSSAPMLWFIARRRAPTWSLAPSQAQLASSQPSWRSKLLST
jgi:hypothetical protein